MAVDRAGHAYVELSNNEIWQVDTLTAACTQAPFSSKKFTQFGMGFSANVTDPGETLFVASNSGLLGAVDLSTFVVHEVGPFSQPIGSAELSGTGDGRLFAFGIVNGSAKTHLAEIDKTDATVLSDVELKLGNSMPTAWAFGAFGGEFYFFTSEGGGPSTVHRYDPISGQLDKVATADGIVVGAGVSTCAPVQ
jgi:hypothetical protein